MEKPNITKELQYISGHLSQSYPDSLDKYEHDKAQIVFEDIKELYPKMIEALIEVESYLTVELDYEWSEEVCEKLMTVRKALQKAGVEK